MAGVLQDQARDPDAWGALYVGLAFLIAPSLGMVATGLARGAAIPRAVLAILVVVTAAHGGALLA